MKARLRDPLLPSHPLPSHLLPFPPSSFPPFPPPLPSPPPLLTLQIPRWPKGDCGQTPPLTRSHTSPQEGCQWDAAQEQTQKEVAKTPAPLPWRGTLQTPRSSSYFAPHMHTHAYTQVMARVYASALHIHGPLPLSHYRTIHTNLTLLTEFQALVLLLRSCLNIHQRKSQPFPKSSKYITCDRQTDRQTDDQLHLVTSCHCIMQSLSSLLTRTAHCSIMLLACNQLELCTSE